MPRIICAKDYETLSNDIATQKKKLQKYRESQEEAEMEEENINDTQSENRKSPHY